MPIRLCRSHHTDAGGYHEDAPVALSFASEDECVHCWEERTGQRERATGRPDEVRTAFLGI